MSIVIQQKIKSPRHTFSLIQEVMAMPYLLETQMHSYREFLQAETPPDQRDRQKGLQEAFCSIYPIQTAGNPTTLEFVEYSLGTPKYDVRECLQRGMTYAAPLKVKLQLIVREVDPDTGHAEIRDIKEQESYMGDIPLMTDQGTFIINGAERVVVSQLHRSPGISFSSAVHQNGKNTYSARVIPYRGAWVEFEVDIYNVMHVIIDRKRKIPATIFLRAFGLETDEAIAEKFFDFEEIKLDDFSLGKTAVKDLDKYTGEEFIEDVFDEKLGKRLAEKGGKVTTKVINTLKNAGIDAVQLTVAESYSGILGRILAKDVIDKKTGEILGETFERVTTTFLRRCAQAKINKIWVLQIENEETNVLLATIEKDKTKCFDEAVVEIFKRLRPGNPVSVSSGKRLIEDTFFNEKRYDLGLVGRYKINIRFRHENATESRLLDLFDIEAVVRHLIELHAERDEVDDIDHL
ncbi:MAG: DNA-directed RNA polymerase subunit beta, partial [Candidatus Sumerlaeota bacterium]|nr:DNA-directed RNA polymerase subunit beta [Candidatus Sumerlaeota bacterium]